MKDFKFWVAAVLLAVLATVVVLSVCKMCKPDTVEQKPRIDTSKTDTLYFVDHSKIIDTI